MAWETPLAAEISISPPLPTEKYLPEEELLVLVMLPAVAVSCPPLIVLSPNTPQLPNMVALTHPLAVTSPPVAVTLPPVSDRSQPMAMLPLPPDTLEVLIVEPANSLTFKDTVTSPPAAVSVPALTVSVFAVAPKA